MSQGRLCFHLAPLEMDFCIDLIDYWVDKYPQSRLYFSVCSENEARQILSRFPHLVKCGDFTLHPLIERGDVPDIAIAVTTEQYTRPFTNIPTYCCFHGQPSKGQTLTTAIDQGYTGFLLYGPLHRGFVEWYYSYHYERMPEEPRLYNVGYTKSDKLLQGFWKRDEELSKMGLSPDRPTILYAPAYNEGASLREFGPELVGTLARMSDCNVIIKLAVDNYASLHDMRCTGGIDWFQTLSAFERFPHVHLYRDMRIDPALAAADVLVTDVSSVGFEFMVLGKPVVFIDIPRFYSSTLKKIFPHEDIELWKNRTDINGGREFGTLAKNLDELEPAVRSSLERKPCEDYAHIMQQKLLYNSGNSLPVAAKLLHHLLQEATDIPVDRRRRHISRDLPPGHGYYNAKELVRRAKLSGRSINDYLEFHEDTPKKHGHRDRIISAMAERNLLNIEGQTVLEIGPGTGRFLEKVLEKHPARYEIYETAPDWCAMLQQLYGGEGSPLVIHPADGFSFCFSRQSSCDLIHAHAVFIYLTFTNIVEYLKECARVCKRNGIVCFDLFYDTDWSLFTAECWHQKALDFPTVLSRTLMDQLYCDLKFTVVDEFTEIYGASFSRYVVLKKE